MAAKIIYIAAVVLECVFVPIFLKYSWPQKCWKSFGFKTVCSALFITACVCAMSYAHNSSGYAKMILVGLIFGMIGDLILHLIIDNQLVFGAGLVAFLIGHIFYIIAISKALTLYLPNYSVFNWKTILISLVVFGVFVLVAKLLKMKFGIALIPCIIYALVISFMVVNALQLCILYVTNSIDYEAFGCGPATRLFLTMGIGSVLFLMSDATLALGLFGGQEKNRPLKIFNILTYYAGQILIGTGTFWIGTQIGYLNF